MSTSAKTLTPEQRNALAKFQAFAGRQAAVTPQAVGDVFQTLIQASPDSEQELQYFRNKIIQQGSLTQDIIREIGQKNPYKYIEYQIKTSLHPTSSGGVWQSDPEFYPAFLAKSLVEQGITDLNDIDKKTTTGSRPSYDYETGQTFNEDFTETVYTNKRTGKVIEYFHLPTTYAGKGGTRAELFIENGKPIIKTSGFDTSGKRFILPVLGIATAIAAPYLLPGIIGTAGAGTAALANTANAAAALGGASTAGLVPSGLAGAFANAGLGATAANALAAGTVHGTVQGGLSSLAGGKFGKGFASGFVGGAAPVVAGPVTQTLTQAGLSPALAKIATSGAIGGLSAAAGGKNVGQGVLGSALNTGIGIGMDKAGITNLPAPVRGVVTEGISSAIRGKPFDLASAAQNAALNYGLNQTIGSQGTKAVNAFLSYKNMADNLGRVKASPSNAIAAFNAFKAQRP